MFKLQLTKSVEQLQYSILMLILWFWQVLVNFHLFRLKGKWKATDKKNLETPPNPDYFFHKPGVLSRINKTIIIIVIIIIVIIIIVIIIIVIIIIIILLIFWARGKCLVRKLCSKEQHHFDVIQLCLVFVVIIRSREWYWSHICVNKK